MGYENTTDLTCRACLQEHQRIKARYVYLGAITACLAFTRLLFLSLLPGYAIVVSIASSLLKKHQCAVPSSSCYAHFTGSFLAYAADSVGFEQSQTHSIKCYQRQSPTKMRRYAADTELALRLAVTSAAFSTASASTARIGTNTTDEASAVSKFLLGFFNRIFQQRPHARAEVVQHSSLLYLPDEILSTIVDQLPFPSQLALRPTCRRLYWLAFAAGGFRTLIPTDKLDFLGTYEHDAQCFVFDKTKRATCSFHLVWHKAAFFLPTELERSYHDRQCLLICSVWIFPRLALSALELTEALRQKRPLDISSSYSPPQLNISIIHKGRNKGRPTTSLSFAIGHVPPDFHADLAVEKVSSRTWQLKLKTWVALCDGEQQARQKLLLMKIPVCNHSTVRDFFDASHKDQHLPIVMVANVCPYPGCLTSCELQIWPKEVRNKFPPHTYVLYIERIIQQSRSSKWEIDAETWKNLAFPNRKLVEMELLWKKHIRWS